MVLDHQAPSDHGREMQGIIIVRVQHTLEEVTAILPNKLEIQIVARIKKRPAKRRINRPRIWRDAIDAVNLVALLKEVSNKVATNKAGCASHQNLTHWQSVSYKVQK